MTITSQWVEPLNDEHHDKIIAAFNMHFIDEGGQQDGNGSGDGYGDDNDCGDDDDGVFHSYGDGNGGKCPEEWRVK